MTIKHLIISGGGPLGFRYLSSLETLNNENFWKIEDIESIYGTSIGSIIGTFLCLKYDWETLNTYLIERPWHESFKMSPKKLFESYYNKGIYDKKIIELILKPLLEAKDLSLSINLQQFYEYSHIDLHIFSFELNAFKIYEMSHTTHPELLLIDALAMSSSLPGVFIPIIQNDECFIDGGVMCNCPVIECLRDHPNEDECLAVTSSYSTFNELYMNASVNEESSLLDYVICFFTNSMNYIRESSRNKKIKNTVKCCVNFNPLTIDVIVECVSNKEMRREWFNNGINDAHIFLKMLEENVVL